MTVDTFFALAVGSQTFPRGLDQYVLGGLLIGIGISSIYLLTAIVPGSSTFLESTLSYVSGASRFQQYVSSRWWRNLFTAGIVSGGVVYAVVVAGGPWTTEVQWYRLLVGGFLVGIGTRIGKGCTTGHGICGVASRSPTSIANVVTFMGTAILTATVVAATGVTP
ncbi:MAG: YeeE/YedE family protein [Halanaeroarchaeum sp.]